MKCEHDPKNGAQQANIWGVRGHRANDDQMFSQSHFQSQVVGVLGEIDTAVKEPPLHRDGHCPDAER